MIKKLFVVCLFLCFLINLQAFDTPEELALQLLSANPGNKVNLGFSSGYEIYNATDKLVDSEGHLLYSDDPETAKEYGILYQDTFEAGLNRIYIYHVNGMSEAAKISTVLENTTNKEAHIFFDRKSLPSPSKGYLQVGIAGVKEFYENKHLPSEILLKPGESVLLDPELDSTCVKNGELLGVIYDCHSNVSLKISTIILPTTQNTLDYYNNDPVFAVNDGHYRQGTFYSNTRKTNVPYEYNTLNGIKAIEIASNPKYTDYDLPLEGKDAERDYIKTTLPGNYGVTYSIDINTESSDGRKLAVLLNPRGGRYDGYFQTKFGDSSEFNGLVVPKEDGEKILLPTEGGVIAVVQPTENTQKLTIEFIPAGSTFLPIRILLVPF